VDFKTKAHEKVYKRVNGYLHDVFGEMVKVLPDSPHFLLQTGSALSHIVILPWGDDDAVVSVRAYVAYGSDLRPDLLKFLLEQNDRMRFGAFGIDSDGDIFFEHTIAGSTCDKEEVRASTIAVTQTADRYDDKIIERWGGMREIDRIKNL
jgi:hypothetical protein